MPTTTTVKRWLRKDEEFRTQYTRAREEQADGFLELITEIANDTSVDVLKTSPGTVLNAVAVSRAKLQIDTLKWCMAKQAPKKYSEKMDLTTGGDKLPGIPVIQIVAPT